jgi:glutaminase
MAPIQALLESLHHRYRDLDEGTLASYIPQLAKANPDWFGISVVTVDGQQFSVGDVAQPFTIQSISKVFVYGMALEDYGRDRLTEESRG